MASIKDIAWLAGIFDGEGHLGIHCLKSIKYGCRKCQITNTDLGIINKCAKILRDLNIYFVIAKQPKNNERSKQCYNIRIDRVQEIINFINILYPYIQSNEKQFTMLKVREQLLIRKVTCDGRKLNFRSSKGQLKLIKTDANGTNL